MKERPIVFNGEMVRSILDGRKTQFRVPVKPQPEPIPEDVWKDKRVPSERQFWWPSKKAGQMVELRDMASLAPLGTVGERLWVRETWGLMAHHDPTDWFHGRIRGMTEDDVAPLYAIEHRANWKLESDYAYWRPSIHMPRWASRIDLEITRVWVERVRDITDFNAFQEGAKSEVGGITGPYCMSFKQGFYSLWQSIYGTWAANPWVWAYEFRRIKP